MKRLLLIFIYTVFAVTMRAAAIYTLTVTVTDADDGEPLCFAVVDAGKGPLMTDVDGNLTMRLRDGSYSLKVTYIGYQDTTVAVALKADTRIKVRLGKQEQLLKEVVISAREGNGMASGSRIDRAAMEHLQPSSFTDLLELLPGNISKDPDMGSANSITLRETGSVSATGARTSVSDDYAITSLGTAFVVDGVPMNTDANMQGVPSTSSGDAAARRSSVNRGVDMRTISTDNIESVDIVRGIPSAEYGNLSSGLVNIKRTRRVSALTARFKADGYSKLFSVGKGFGITGHDHIINADLSWLDSKIDPRDNLENYKRLTASVRAGFNWRRDNITALWNVGTDYTGSFDNAKVDPDLNYNKIDEYKSQYNRMALSSDLTLRFLKPWLITGLSFTISVSLDNDIVERRKQVAPQRASVAPTSMEEGVHDGVYLTREYIADFRSESRPLSFFAKLRADGNRASGICFNEYKAGADLSVTKNYGKGQIYDLTRPLSASWTTRPRDFSEIPSLPVLSCYAEDNVTLSLGAAKLQTQFGVRGISLLPADGLVIFESKFLTTEKREYTPDIMDEAVTVQALYQVPGSGTDHPVEPGEYFLICDVAMDHRQANPNSFDLSHADFEWYDESTKPGTMDIDSPLAPNLDKWYCYTQTVWLLHNRGFKAYGIARIPTGRDSYLSRHLYSYDYEIVTMAGTFPMSGTAYSLPNEWVTDMVTCSVPSEYAWQLCSPALDSGYTYCGTVDNDKTRFFRSVRRKMVSLNAAGNPVLQDTNNSSADFNAFVIPSEIEAQHTAIDSRGTPATTLTYDGVIPIAQ